MSMCFVSFRLQIRVSTDINARSYLDGETWPSHDVAVEAGCTLISAINLNLSVKAEVKAEGRPAGGGLRGE